MLLNFTSLAKVMRLASESDSVTLVLPIGDLIEFNVAMLTVKLERMGRDIEFQMKVYKDSEPDSLSQSLFTQLVLPDYTSIININSMDFSRICKELGGFADTVELQTDPEFLKFAWESLIGRGDITMKCSE